MSWQIVCLGFPQHLTENPEQIFSQPHISCIFFHYLLTITYVNKFVNKRGTIMYRKNVTPKLIIGTLTSFVILLIFFHFLLKPFQKVENELNIIEHNIDSKNWNVINNSLNKIDDLWSKYEILLRVLNRRDITDDFVLHLDQCKLLAKYKDDNMLEYLSILKDDVKDMMHVIPSP